MDLIDIRQPSPLQTLDVGDLFSVGATDLRIKRDDLIHRIISGNKWRKLKYFLSGLPGNKRMIVSTGGVHSNHLHALGYWCYRCQMPCTVFIRRYNLELKTQVLSDLRTWGIKIVGLDNSTISSVEADNDLAGELLGIPPAELLYIPMGGAGPHSAHGVQEIVQEVENELGSDPIHWVLPAGTGTTACGMIQKSPDHSVFTIFIPFKRTKIANQVKLSINQAASTRSLQINFIDARFSDYAMMDQDMLDFIQQLFLQTNIRFDPVYNGPMMYHLHKMNAWLSGDANMQSVIVHTGGLQGWRGMYERYRSEIQFGDFQEWLIT
jgi:1-aminocyclopropane-1-carboxylate deaminase